MSKRFSRKVHKRFNKLAQSLIDKTEAEIKHFLAELEIKEGESARKEVEFEINLLKRKRNYLKEAETFYSNRSNIGRYPKDFKQFPLIKQKAFKRVNARKKAKIKLSEAKIRRNEDVIEKLLRYRIKHTTKKYSEHLIPKDKSIKGITAEISMEADRLYYIWKRLYDQHKETPYAKSYGLSIEEEKILKKIEKGIYPKKGVELIEEEIGPKTGTKAQLKQQLLKNKDLVMKVGNGYYNKGKERINELAKENWHRNIFNKFEFIALKEMGYEESHKNHRPAYDLNGKIAPVIAYRFGGFKDNTTKGDRRESLHHFSKPYFLKEIIPETVIQYQIPGTKHIADAMIPVTKNKKVGIEFQKSLQDKYELIKKINYEIDYFDIVIVVCNKQDLEFFNSKIKHEKVFIMYNKQFFTDFVPKYKEV